MAQEEEARAEASRLERQRLSVTSVPDEQLFFVDKVGDLATVFVGAP